MSNLIAAPRRLLLAMLLVGAASAIVQWTAIAGDKQPSADAATSLALRAVTASSTTAEHHASGAADGDRFSCEPTSTWVGASDQPSWYWQADLGQTAQVGAVLQILGDSETSVAAVPLAYVWQASTDGNTWSDLESTRNAAEYRMYRIHRLEHPTEARYLRLAIQKTGGPPPAVREVEVYSTTDAKIEFPDWVLCVNSFESPSIDDCYRFLDLARQCDGWGGLLGQYIWHGHVDPAMALAEPRPLCAFYTGSFRDWCEVDNTTWKGTERLIHDGSLPMWGACGGGQAFGILAETGADHPWDCPKCRDASDPKLPIYGHIGLIDPARVTACGDYSNNVYESGPTPVRLVQHDPVFDGLPEEFLVPENHCGQLEFLPDGWDLLVTKARGGKTWMQCMKQRGTCIYAAQFHIELPETPEVSRRIMSNFLAEASRWSAAPRDAAGSN